jgi:hypothetical protein
VILRKYNKAEIGGACGTCGEKEKYIQSFGGENQNEEIPSNS